MILHLTHQGCYQFPCVVQPESSCMTFEQKNEGGGEEYIQLSLHRCVQLASFLHEVANQSRIVFGKGIDAIRELHFHRFTADNGQAQPRIDVSMDDSDPEVQSICWASVKIVEFGEGGSPVKSVRFDADDAIWLARFLETHIFEEGASNASPDQCAEVNKCARKGCKQTDS